MKDRDKLYLDEIGNIALRNMILAGKLDDPRGVTAVFKHRYNGGQCDWGYITPDGYYSAWYGGDCADCVEDVDELDIINEWTMDYVDV